MTVRQQQVEALLKRAVSNVLQRKISDPRIKGLVSVTRVQVSPDLRQAGVYVSVLPAKYEPRTIAGLRSARGHIHRLVSRAMAFKRIPQLQFLRDASLKNQATVFAAIQQGLDREEQSR